MTIHSFHEHLFILPTLLYSILKYIHLFQRVGNQRLPCLSNQKRSEILGCHLNKQSVVYVVFDCHKQLVALFRQHLAPKRRVLQQPLSYWLLLEGCAREAECRAARGVRRASVPCAQAHTSTVFTCLMWAKLKATVLK